MAAAVVEAPGQFRACPASATDGPAGPAAPPPAGTARSAARARPTSPGAARTSGPKWPDNRLPSPRAAQATAAGCAASCRPRRPARCRARPGPRSVDQVVREDGRAHAAAGEGESKEQGPAHHEQRGDQQAAIRQPGGDPACLPVRRGLACCLRRPAGARPTTPTASTGSTISASRSASVSDSARPGAGSPSCTTNAAPQASATTASHR